MLRVLTSRLVRAMLEEMVTKDGSPELDFGVHEVGEDFDAGVVGGSARGISSLSEPDSRGRGSRASYSLKSQISDSDTRTFFSGKVNLAVTQEYSQTRLNTYRINVQYVLVRADMTHFVSMSPMSHVITTIFQSKVGQIEGNSRVTSRGWWAPTPSIYHPNERQSL